jgi:hypothetical protein
MRLKAASIHLALSVGVAGVAAALVFGLWYPGAYRHLSGGQSLFWLIVGVDVVLGPLLTLIAFNPKKPRAELVRDLGMIALVQLSALGYGTWTLFEARPVHLVFEVDRFRVVSAADIDTAALPQAPQPLQRLPLAGPTMIAARLSRDNKELLTSVEAASAGLEISMQPQRWQPYDAVFRAAALARALPWPQFAQRHAAEQGLLATAAADAARHTRTPREQLRALPVQSRFGVWTVLLDATGEPVAWLPIDPF